MINETSGLENYVEIENADTGAVEYVLVKPAEPDADAELDGLEWD
jgi:hypothetical protein